MAFTNYLPGSSWGVLWVALAAASGSTSASAQQSVHLDGSVRWHLDDGGPPSEAELLSPDLATLEPVLVADPWAEMLAAERVAMEDSAAGVEGACACGAAKRCPGVCRDPGHPEKPHRTLPGDRDLGDCPPYRYELNDCVRAGNPHVVAPWAKPSITNGYSAWFVGGGAAIGGRAKGPHEGTWGLDYDGWLKPRRVWMNWTCGRSQGGEGAYATEKRAHRSLRE